MTVDVDALLDRGRTALAACDWATARRFFEQAQDLAEIPEALDGLGQARYWQGDYAEALALRERAYALYRQRNDRSAAALVAIQLAQLHALVYGNAAAMNGWIGHAQRMLSTCEDCAVHGWVELFLGCITSDPGERERRAGQAVATGRRFDDPALEFDALAYVGLALVEQGSVADGMTLVDEAVAAATGGLVQDPWAAGEIYCTLFHACELAIDVRRAEQWLDTVDHYVERTGELPISAICRMHYGGLLAAAGRWQQAELELGAAIEIYEQTYRGTRFEPLRRLAELRVRQGRFEEAERLVEGHQDDPGAALPVARLLLERGEPEQAKVVIERRLAGGVGIGLVVAPLLALAVQVDLDGDDPDSARSHAAALTEVAATTGQPSVSALAALSHARIAAAEDAEGADALFEEALRKFGAADLTHDVATTRLELARVLADRRPDVARGEADAALRCFQRLGASRDADAAAGLLRQLGARSGRSWPQRGEGPLTARQREVLDLVAEGLSNAEIAERLYISPRTAEHHVSNILSALGLTSRTEAAAHALRRRP